MSNSAEGAAAPALPAPSLAELFLAFAKISLSGFGGVLPWARRMMVDERRWMTAQEFNEAFALCQFLPGPNIVNMSIIFGSRIRGIPGAIVTLTGLMGPPVLLVTIIGMLYARYGEIAGIQRGLAGVSAAAAGLILATAAKMAGPMLRLPLSPAPFIGAACFCAIGLLRLPLPWVLAALVPLSIALAWWMRR